MKRFFLLLLGAVLLAAPAFADTASKTVSTATDQTSDANDIWVLPANAQGATDASYATWAGSTGDLATIPGFSDYLKCAFAFTSSDVPVGSTISGITVVWRGHGSAPALHDQAAFIMTAGTIQTGWTNKATDTSVPNPSDADVTYGSGADVWGSGGLSQSDVTNANFGVGLRWANTSGTTRTFSLDSVTMTVTFTPPAVTQPKKTLIGTGHEKKKSKDSLEACRRKMLTGAGRRNAYMS